MCYDSCRTSKGNEMIQKTVQKQSRKEEEVQEKAPEAQDRRVSADAEDMLAEIDCCLADNEADAKKALKAQGETEWNAIQAEYAKSEDWKEFWVARQVWIAKYADLFEWCCGEPIFDE